jgi:hypothetical protein
MSTPGDLKVVSKGTDQLIPATGPTDGGTLLRFRDSDQGIDTDRFILPVGRTGFELQFQAIFSSTVAGRPTWVQFEVARLRGSSVDTTGKDRQTIVQPGTTTYPYVYSCREYVNEDDGAFGITVTHNGTSAIRITVDSLDAFAPIANMVHKLGGFNQWSDGTIH